MDATYHLSASINMPLTTVEGRGDADINTKSGRSTRITAGWHLKRRAEGLSHAFDVSFMCRIQELNPDYSTISNGHQTHILSFESDPNLEIVHVPTGSFTYSANVDGDYGNAFGFTRVIKGQQRGWLNWTSEPLIRGAGFTRFYIRVDGPGRDDRGNCAIDATLRIPVTTRQKKISGQSTRFEKALAGNRALRVKVSDHLLAARKELGLRGGTASVRKSRFVPKFD